MKQWTFRGKNDFTMISGHITTHVHWNYRKLLRIYYFFFLPPVDFSFFFSIITYKTGTYVIRQSTTNVYLLLIHIYVFKKKTICFPPFCSLTHAHVVIVMGPTFKCVIFFFFTFLSTKSQHINTEIYRSVSRRHRILLRVRGN